MESEVYMVKTVYLSPSTQENNIGAGQYGSEEGIMNRVTGITQKILEQHGIIVYRNKPEMTLAQVVKDSNSKNPCIHFAIHSNALNGKARGCEVFCHRYGGEGEKLARAVYDELSPLTPSEDRGVKEGHSHFGLGKPLFELANTNAPAALVEVAFHDNDEDAKWIAANIEKIGTALARGVLKYFGIEYVTKASEIKKAVEALEGAGIITNPSYWVENALPGKTVRGEFAAALIKRTALILKGGKLK